MSHSKWISDHLRLNNNSLTKDHWIYGVWMSDHKQNFDHFQPDFFFKISQILLKNIQKIAFCRFFDKLFGVWIVEHSLYDILEEIGSTIPWYCNINDFTHFLFFLHSHYVWSSLFLYMVALKSQSTLVLFVSSTPISLYSNHFFALSNSCNLHSSQ